MGKVKTKSMTCSPLNLIRFLQSELLRLKIVSVRCLQANLCVCVSVFVFIVVSVFSSVFPLYVLRLRCVLRLPTGKLICVAFFVFVFALVYVLVSVFCLCLYLYWRLKCV